MIGEGAFARVYKAKKKSDGSACVIKLIEKSKLNT
jgi:serine/threonine protein kinase